MKAVLIDKNTGQPVQSWEMPPPGARLTPENVEVTTTVDLQTGMPVVGLIITVDRSVPPAFGGAVFPPELFT